MRAAAEVAVPRLRSFPIAVGAVAGGAATLLFWALFFGGGSRDLGVTWLGTAAVLAAALAGRLLERARASRRHGDRARPLGRGEARAPAGGASGRGRAALRGRRLGAPRVLARGSAGGGGRRRSLDRGSPGAAREPRRLRA